MPRIQRTPFGALRPSERFAISLAIYSIEQLCKKVAEMLDDSGESAPPPKVAALAVHRRRRRRKTNKTAKSKV